MATHITDSNLSEVVPFVYCLVPGSSRPHVQVRHTASDKVWLV